jgi:hypothetical protein
MAEVAFVGRLGTVPLAALALMFPLLMLMQMLANGAIGGVAAAVLAVAVFWGNPQAPVDPVASAALTDLDILLEGEELDLLEELEFYAWLLAQPELLEPAIEQDDNG